ncbi:MAG: GIY-YIG nuclease family protein [Halovenus sp.]
MLESVGGTYTLCVELPEPATIPVGALGETAFEPGWYAYCGTALGSGGFSRIDRHAALAAGEREVRHWHVDYLLCHRTTRLETVERTPDVDGECAVVAALDGTRIPAFGCSDCDCSSHLVYSADRARLLGSVRRAHRQLDGQAGRE